METKDLIAKAEVHIAAPASTVWDALVNPEIIKKYMFGTVVSSDWKENSKITWQGEWKGKPYEDKGEILKIEPKKLLRYSHFSPLTGEKDIPENYHTVTIELKADGDKTAVALSQDNNADEKGRLESENNWGMMLNSLKKVVEEKN